MEGPALAPGGNNLGKYRLIAELGHGGMAEVFLAVVNGPAGFNKLVVIKQIRPALASDPEFLGMFLDEARLAARLSHPNVVQTNEVGELNGRYFIAMEFLEGQPLNRVQYRLREKGGIPLALHLKIISDVLGGLHHAHELADYDGTPLGVVHRDVTPHNTFVTYDGQVKVVDFGIAKALNSSAETATGVLKGKVAYMAPEQAQGARVDRRADIYSVGVMLWEAVVGRRMWKGTPDITILQRILSGELPPVREARPDVSPKLEAIIAKALSFRREDRYASAAELQAVLDDYLTHVSERAHARDVSRLLMQAFEADRAQLKATIEEQLRAKPSGAQPLPVISEPTHSGSGSSRSGERSNVFGSGSGSGPVELIGSGSSSSQSFTGLPVTGSAPSRAEPGRKRGLFAIAALVAGSVIGAGAWKMAGGPAAAPAPEVASSAPAVSIAPRPAESAAPAPAPVASIELSVAASPREAKIFLDGAPLDGNPAKTTVSRGGATHEVRIEAPGYATKTDTITFERDRSVDVALVRAAPESAARRPAASPAPPSDEMTRAPVKKPQRTLDSSNPYAK